MRTPHMHTHVRMHICTLMRVCVFAQTRYLWYLAPPPLPPPHATCSPQLGGMVDILVAFSGAIDSGDGHPPSNLGCRFGSSGAVKGKPESEQSSGRGPVDYVYVFVLFSCVLGVARCAFLLFIRVETRLFRGAC